VSEPVKNKAESIRQRLRNRLRERGEDVQFGLQRYAVERFLYRLGVSEHRERFVLKGAALFALWGGSIYRPTRDLDFTGYGSADEADVLTALREICLPLNQTDDLFFDPNALSAEPIRDDSEYNGLRIRLEVTLGKSRIPIQIDIGFGNAVEPAPQYAEFPTLLDDPPPRIRTYPPEAVIAEKLHAMVTLGERNSRLKDFYDIYVLARQFPFTGEQLKSAIAATFGRRNTPIDAAQPAALGPRFYADTARSTQWRTYLERNHLPGAPADFDSVGELIRQFLGPVWRGLAENVAFASNWPPGGPWNSENRENEISTATAFPFSLTSHGQRHSLDADTVGIENIEIPTATPLRRFKLYPVYKDSGVEWLGEIPAHWEIVPLKRRITSLKDGTHGTFERVIEGVPLLSAKNVGVDGRLDVSDAESLISESDYEQINRNGYLQTGDLLLTIVGTIGRAAVFDYPEPVAFQRSVAVIRPASRLSVKFFYHLSQADFFQHSLQQSSKKSAQGGVYLGDIAEVPVLVPPLPEQRAIDAFLDRETAKIDALVAKKERLIELLQEKRAALITRAVTKGLDPNVRMKESGVEWFWEIPAHWRVVRVKHTLEDRISGPFGSSLTKDSYAGNTYRVYGQEQVIPGDFTVGDYYIPESKFRAMMRYAVLAGDVLLSCVGTFGKAVVVPEGIEPGIINPRLILLRPDQNMLVPAYLELFLRSELSFSQMDQISRGGTMDIINLSTISALVMPLPLRAEQTKILEAVRTKNSRIDRLITKVREGIGRLKELRTALISAAVTGKIDVREEAA
jgi:type I restriction enzyme, S subunit